MNVTYEFFENDHRQRILTLTIELMNELAKQEPPAERATVGWTEYQASQAKRLVEMDREGPKFRPRRGIVSRTLPRFIRQAAR